MTDVDPANPAWYDTDIEQSSPSAEERMEEAIETAWSLREDGVPIAKAVEQAAEKYSVKHRQAEIAEEVSGDAV